MIAPFSFVTDFETTGFCPIRNDIVSMGLVVLDDKLKVIDTLYLKFKPDLYNGVTEENVATHVHGFTLSEMLFFPERRKSLIELLHFLKKYKCPSNNTRPLFYHALKGFDYLFLEWAFRKEDLAYTMWKVFDFPTSHSTVLLARSLGYEGNKLNQWAERMSLSFNHHNALDDAMMCAKLLQYTLKHHFNNEVELLFEHLGKVKDNDLQKVQDNEKPSGFFNI